MRGSPCLTVEAALVGGSQRPLFFGGVNLEGETAEGVGAVAGAYVPRVAIVVIRFLSAEHHRCAGGIRAAPYREYVVAPISARGSETGDAGADGDSAAVGIAGAADGGRTLAFGDGIDCISLNNCSVSATSVSRILPSGACIFKP